MFMKQKFVATLAAVAVFGVAVVVPASAAEEAKAPANGHTYPSIEKTSADAPKQHKMSPEFQAQVKKLPPEFIQQFKKMTAKHTRYSEDATTRQVIRGFAFEKKPVVNAETPGTTVITAPAAPGAALSKQFEVEVNIDYQEKEIQELLGAHQLDLVPEYERNDWALISFLLPLALVLFRYSMPPMSRQVVLSFLWLVIAPSFAGI